MNKQSRRRRRFVVVEQPVLTIPLEVEVFLHVSLGCRFYIGMPQRVGRRLNAETLIHAGRVLVTREINDQIIRQIGPFPNTTKRRASTPLSADGISRKLTPPNPPPDTTGWFFQVARKRLSGLTSQSPTSAKADLMCSGTLSGS